MTSSHRLPRRRRVAAAAAASSVRVALLLASSSSFSSLSLLPFFRPSPASALAFPSGQRRRAWALPPPNARGVAIGRHFSPRGVLGDDPHDGAPSWALRDGGPGRYDFDLAAAAASPDPVEDDDDDDVEASAPSSSSSSSSIGRDLRGIATLVGVQSLLLPISYFLARSLNVANGGLGTGFAWTTSAAALGLKWTAPLFVVAGIMQLLEPYSESLQGVTRATQRSVLAVMGKERRPLFALVVSVLLGAVAGWGEEWLFRGVFQTLLADRFSGSISLAICGVVFGLLHAVTPVYALLAGLASVFFGYLYNSSANLAVPIICHAVYDVGALMWAHWSVTALTEKEQDEILEGGAGAPIMSASAVDK